MNPLVAQVTGKLPLQEELTPAGTIEGFVAIEPDGRVFAGTREHGILVMRSADYLKRIVSVDARIHPVTLTFHPDSQAGAGPPSP